MSGCILLPELPKAAYLSSDAFKAALTPPTARPPATRLNTARRLGSSISLAIWAQKKKLWHFSRLHWILWRNCGKSQNSMLHHATHVTWQNGMLYNFHAMIHYSAVPLVVMLMSVHLTYCRIFRTYISTNETNKWTNRQKLATRWIWNCLSPKSKQSDKWWYINANVNVKVYNRFASESQTHPEPYGPPGSGCGPSAHHRAQQLLRSVSFVSSTSTASPHAHDAHVFRHFLSNFSMSKLSKRRRTSPGLLTVPQKPE